MLINRRALLGAATTLLAPLLIPRSARAATITDDAGRTIPIPAKVERVFVAGPPAAILLYTFAPDLLIGWTRTHRPEECEFLGPGACQKPEVGRITGRGNTANLEVVLSLKPDLILDVGSINDTYVSLANRVQEQTGIPYALLDGRFAAMVATYRKLGALTQRVDQAEAQARYAEQTIATIKSRIEKIPPAGLLRPRPAQARDRPRRLDQHGDHRVSRRPQRRGRAQGRDRQRVGRAGAGLESRCHHHHRPRLCGERAQ
jgi:iron complex transport system substrate-binding protein